MINLMQLPANEAERLAYSEGFTGTAELFARLSDAEHAAQSAQDALAHVQEARSAFPAEDCLQNVIEHAQMLARGRVTKADVQELVEMLENLQLELARSAEHGLDELKRAEAALS